MAGCSAEGQRNAVVLLERDRATLCDVMSLWRDCSTAGDAVVLEGPRNVAWRGVTAEGARDAVVLMERDAQSQDRDN